jgi:acetyl-CoA C-acetyltransferase
MSTVKVAGMGWAQPGEGEQLSHAELLYRATRQALDDAGLKRDSITSAVTTSYDYVEGRNLSNQFTLDSIGGVMKSCDLRLSDDGVHSIAAGSMEALSEPGGVVVVGAVQMAGTELIDSTNRAVEEVIFEPLFLRPVLAGSAHPEALAFGLAARAYLARHGVAESRLAELVAARSAGGAQARTVDEILDSPVIAGPIRDGHRARRADAAATLILTTDAPNGSRATIRGCGWCAEDGQLGNRDLSEQRPTALAAKQAYAAAGVSDPKAELARVEAYNAYAIDEAMAAEALGLAGPGEGFDALLEGAPVNPTGGVQASGWARGAASLVQAVRAMEEMKDEPGALLASQGWCGPGASSSAVAVFEIDG